MASMYCLSICSSLLLIHMDNISMYVISGVQPAGRSFCVAET